MPTIQALFTRRQWLMGAAALAVPCVLHAQTQARSIVVGYPPGGAMDVMARLLVQHLPNQHGSSVVVENKPGFSGHIAAQTVAKAAPDGNTLLMTAVTSQSIGILLIGNAAAGYDMLKSFEHVAILGQTPNVLIIPTSLGIDSLTQFIEVAKTKPGTFDYATTGNGSTEHIGGEMFKRATGVQMQAVPYKGSAPAMTDLIGGRIQLMFVNPSTAINNLGSGRIKVVGVAGPERLTAPALSDVPTLRESGVVMLRDLVSMYGLSAPAGTPRAVVERWNADVNEALAQADLRERFDNFGVQTVRESAAYATQRVADEMLAWRKILQETGIRLES